MTSLSVRSGPDGLAETTLEQRASVARQAGFYGAWRWTGLILAVSDLASLTLSILLGYIALSLLAPLLGWKPGFGGGQDILYGVLFIPITFWLWRLYPGYRLAEPERLRRRVWATALVFSLLMLGAFLFQLDPWTKGLIATAFFLALPVLVICEAMVRSYLIRAGRWGEPVVVVGAGATGQRVVQLLRNEPSMGLVPVCFVDDDHEIRGQDINGIPVFGPVSKIQEVRHGANLAILAMPGSPGSELGKLSANLPFTRVIVVPDLMSLQSLWVVPRDLCGVLGLEIGKPLNSAGNRVLKRLLDFVLCLPLFLIFLPFMGFLALAVKANSPGPAFYAHEREGWRGVKFGMLKLRTMFKDSDRRIESYLNENPECRAEWQRFFKLRDDPRIVPRIGHFLRKSSLDELPQFLNVLRGDMSLVGPRPFPEYHLKAFSEEFRELRRSVKPGITGLWQVQARSAGDIEIQEALDTYYIRNWSIWLDASIVIRTVAVVLTRCGAH